MSVINEQIVDWCPLQERTLHTTIMAPGQKIFQGTLAMQVAGKVYSLANGFDALRPVMLNVAGADANGGLLVYSRQANMQLVLLGGISQTFGVSVAYTATNIQVVVQLATSGAGAVTSTANAVVNGILAHATASKYIRVKATGTGLGLAAALVATNVPMFKLLGFAEKTYDNAASLIDWVDEFRFYDGSARLIALVSDPVTPAMVGSNVAIHDEITVKATPSSLDYEIPLIDVTFIGEIFCDVSGKRRF